MELLEQTTSTDGLEPVVAVIIPTYGHPGLMIEAVHSALRQRTTFGYRIIIVNDGCSRAETDKIGKLFASTHPRKVTYVKKKNGGLSSSRNYGIDLALILWPSIQAVYFLDADNIIEPLLLQNAFAVLAENPDAAWVYPDIMTFGSRQLKVETGSPFSRLQMLHSNYCEAGSMVHRKVLDAGLRFDETMRLGYEDWEFWLQAIAAGYTGVNGRFLGFRYRKRSESMLSDSDRDGHEIVGYVRRKHRKLFNFRTSKIFEEDESPRFVICLPSSIDLAVFKSPCHSRPPQTLASVLKSLRRKYRHLLPEPCPSMFIFLAEQTRDLLQSTGLLPNLLWLLEADARPDSVASAVVYKEISTDSRFFISNHDQPPSRVRNGPTVIAITASRLARALEDSTCHENLIVDILEGISTRQVTISSPDLSPGFCPPSQPGLECFLTEAAAFWETEPHAPFELDRNVYRPPTEPDRLWEKTHSTVPPPPIPLDAADRQIGFVLPLCDLGGVERVTHNIAREVKRAGWCVHLFVVGAGEARLLEEFRDVFSSIHLVGDQSLAQPSRLLSLLGGMDVLFLNHAGWVNPALATLRRNGVKLVSQLHLLDLTPEGFPCGPALEALGYEHCLDQIIVISAALKSWLLARGVPQEKILVVRNAPSFEVPDLRLDLALEKREARPPGDPLNVLFLGRLDRQKGLDRLLEIIHQARKKGLPINWRVVGKPVCDDAPTEVLSALDVNRAAPAFDSHSLCHHFFWADVLLLPSRFEGVPLSALEAQLCGCLPFATDVGAVAREVIEDGKTGILLEDVEPCATYAEAFLGRIEPFLKDRTQLHAMARHASAERRRTSWRHTTDSLVRLLNDWVPNRRG